MSKVDGDGRKSSSLSLESSTPQEVVHFILAVFTAQYLRKIENTQAQLLTLRQLDHDELSTFWVHLKKSASSEDALHLFTNWIESKLDGDGLSSSRAKD